MSVEDPFADINALIDEEIEKQKPQAQNVAPDAGKQLGDELLGGIAKGLVGYAAPFISDRMDVKRRRETEGRPDLTAGENFIASIDKGYKGAKASLISLKGMTQEVVGDKEAALETGHYADEVEKSAPKTLVPSLQHIESPGDVLLWASEKFGENIPNLFLSLGSGGGGAATGRLAALLRGSTSREALQQATLRGGIAGGFASSAALETGGTAGEMFEESGGQTFAPHLSIPAGLAKGALEVIPEAGLLKRGLAGGFAGTGLRGVLRETGKTAGKEALTELGQESIDIGANALYRGDTEKVFRTETAWRLAEAGAAGGVVGGITGGAVSGVGALRGPSAPVEVPGERQRENFSLSPIEGAQRLKMQSEPEEAHTLQTRQVWTTGSDLFQAAALMVPNTQLPANQMAASSPMELGAKRKYYALADPTTGTIEGKIFTAEDLTLEGVMRDLAGKELVEINSYKVNPYHITTDSLSLGMRKWEDVKEHRWYPQGTPDAVKAELDAELQFIYEQSVEANFFTTVDGVNDTTRRASRLEQLYQEWLGRGGRVIPDRNSSFLYSGEVSGKAVAAPDLPQINTRSGLSLQQIENDPDLAALSLNPIYFTKDGWNITGNDFKFQLAHNDAMLEIFNLLRATPALVFQAFAKSGIFQYGTPIPTVDARVFDKHSGKEITPRRISPQDESKDRTPFNTSEPKYATRELENQEMHILVTPPLEPIADFDLFEKTVREFYPQIVKLLNRLDMPSGLDLHISSLDRYKAGSQVQVYSGRTFSPWIRVVYEQARAYGPTDADLRFGVADILLHEIGHLVTMRGWERIPVEIKKRVLQKYYRETMRYKMVGTHAGMLRAGLTTIISPGTNESSQQSMQYYFTAVEWLAEQFRRYVFATDPYRNAEERFYKETAAQLERVTKLWGSFAKEGIRSTDMFEPHADFVFMMDWLKREAENKLAIDSSYRPTMYKIQETSEANATLDALGRHANMDELYSAMEAVKRIYPASTQLEATATAREGGSVVAWYNSVLDLATISVWATNPKATLAHEALHALVRHGLVSQGEFEILVREAKRLRVLPQSVVASYRAAASKAWNESPDLQGRVDKDRFVRGVVDEEYAARLVELRYNGTSSSERANGIVDKILAILEVVRNWWNGNGAITHHQVLDLIFSGQAAARVQVREREARIREQMAVLVDDDGAGGGLTKMRDVTSVRQTGIPGVFVAEKVEGAKGERLSTLQLYYSPQAVYTDDPQAMLNQLDRPIGYVMLHEDPLGRGFEVDMVYVLQQARGKRAGLGGKAVAQVLYEQGEKIYGYTAKPSGMLTDDGYQMWKKREPGLVVYHVYSKEDEMWLSPNHIKIALRRLVSVRERFKNDPPESARKQKNLAETKRVSKLMMKVPPQAWKDPRLKEWYARNVNKVGASILPDKTADVGRSVGEMELLYAAGMVEQPMTDPFTEALEQEDEAGRELNYKAIGVPVPRAPEHYQMRVMASRLFPRGEENAEVRKALMRTAGEADRVSYMSRLFMNIQQMAWRNPHISYLQNFVSDLERFNASRMKWISEADMIAGDWDKLGAQGVQRVTRLMQWADRMEYLTDLERDTRQRIGTSNPEYLWPSSQEVNAAARQFKLTADELQVFQRVQGHFVEFFDTVEGVMRERIQQNYTDQKTGTLNQLGYETAIAELENDMNSFRNRPFFPHFRFGKYVVRGYDVNNKLMWYSAHMSKAEQDAMAVRMKKAQPQWQFQIDLMPENVHEFSVLPTPMLRQLRSEVPNLTNEQLQWLDTFIHENSPEYRFQKQMIRQSDVPGYSYDGIRVYAFYFQMGANYLARMEYKPRLQEHVRGLSKASAQRGDLNKRRQIIRMMEEHLQYVMNPGKDWPTIKTLATIWHLGYSIAAAGMNLSQVPVVTLPFLGRVFGATAVMRASASVSSALRYSTFGTVSPKEAGTAFARAREEMIRQNIIDAGQAPQLAAYAEGSNMWRAGASSMTQRRFRQFTTSSMWMFQQAERFNREWTFRMSYTLAMGNPRAEFLTGVGGIKERYSAEILRVSTDPAMNLTEDEATAMLFAKEAIDRTQFNYSQYMRPNYLKNPALNTALIFFQYTTSMLHHIRFNPGGNVTLVILLVLFGAMGMPFAEDLNALIKFLSRKLLGKDFNPEKEARKFVRDLTRGTVFDETGPDLMLHGIARYSFGLGLLEDGYGVPRFDASANGSMGKIIPGAKELFTGWANSDSGEKVVSEVTGEFAGAAYGTIFSAMQFLSNGELNSRDLKNWEKVMPRAAKAVSKSYRFAVEERERTKTGATFVTFDMRNPDDIATVLAQAAGFSPTKLTTKWDGARGINETLKFYDLQRRALMLQMDQAIQYGYDVDPVLNAIERYNDKVFAMDAPSLALTAAQVKASLANRNRTRSLQEQDLPSIKYQRPVAEELQDLYPGVWVERKRVK